MGNHFVTDRGPAVRLVASPSSWIEGEALRQLDAVAALPGVVACVGLPDLHPGKGGPVGAAFLAEDVVYPSLVGSDIGCGMRLFATDLLARRARPEAVAARLDGLDAPLDGDGGAQRARLADAGLGEAGWMSLGTPGRGNHFLEFQSVVEVVDREAFAALGLDREALCLLVHTGSRGVGERVLRDVAAAHGAAGLQVASEDGRAYLEAHGEAVRWAELNRQICGERALAAVRASGAAVLDSCHNSVTPVACPGGTRWLHRKGAAPSFGTAVLPGSRGDLTYLLAPVATERSLWSLAHGAGRKLSRHEARGKLSGRLRRSDLGRNRWDGRVVCGEELLLWEEAPECYKKAGRVVADLVGAGLATVVATMAPVATFKTSLPASGSGGAGWKRERRAARQAKRGER